MKENKIINLKRHPEDTSEGCAQIYNRVDSSFLLRMTLRNEKTN